MNVTLRIEKKYAQELESWLLKSLKDSLTMKNSKTVKSRRDIACELIDESVASFTQGIIDKASVDGTAEIGSGFALSTSEAMVKEQGTWGDEGAIKAVNLAQHPFWLRTNGELVGVNDAEGLKERILSRLDRI